MSAERIFLRGRQVQFGLARSNFGLGDVGDLLAYRQEWEPFVAAHLALWRQLNDLLEGIPTASQCPAGIFDPSKLTGLDATTAAFCASLDLTRTRISDTDPGGILTQWNQWKDMSSAQILAADETFLTWFQNTVLRVGGQYKSELAQIAQTWGIPIELPDVPSFSLQQEIKARIEGAYITAKGLIQIVGYGAGEILTDAADLEGAVAKGLTDTAKALPKTISWAGIAFAAVAALVGGALVVYYVPRKTSGAVAKRA